MAQLKHLKAALKGTQKRLERAEALLHSAMSHIPNATDYYYTFGYIACAEESKALFKKVEKHLARGVDTSE